MKFCTLPERINELTEAAWQPDPGRWFRWTTTLSAASQYLSADACAGGSTMEAKEPETPSTSSDWRRSILSTTAGGNRMKVSAHT